MVPPKVISPPTPMPIINMQDVRIVRFGANTVQAEASQVIRAVNLKIRTRPNLSPENPHT